MAFKKTLVQRLFNLSRFSTPTVARNTAAKPPSEPPETSKIKRNSQRRPLYQSTAMVTPSLRLFPPTGENLAEKLKSMNIAKDRIQLSGLIPFPHAPTPAAREDDAPLETGLSLSEVRKLLRASQTELIRAKFMEVEKDWVSYKEFMEIIEKSCGGNKEQALTFAKTLDDCGSVIVLGNAVCLRPHQEIKTLVAKAIQGLVTPPVVDPNDPLMQELALLEEQKAEIDQKAEALVRRELWAGLGYMVVQTAAFMRLTFWELSWDVMEPICFYVTSAYFMLGYTFFLRTSKEPSFEGFFQSRFNAKQKRLIKTHNFDIERYNELKKAFHPENLPSSLDHSWMIKFDHHKND